MSETTTSFQAAVHGPVHSGVGDQNNFFPIDQVMLTKLVRRRENRRSIALDELRSLAQRFVEPPNHGEASDRLTSSGCVVLTGHRGVGRHATARMLLYRLPEPYVPIRDVSLEDEPDEQLLDGRTIEPGDRLVLDLARVAGAREEKAMGLLGAFRADARERGAHLVILLRAGQEKSLPTELIRLMVDIGRPDGRLVLLRHLRVNGISCSPAQLDVPPLRERMDSRPVGDLAVLAHWITVASERAAGRGTFADWMTQAITAESDHDDEVRERLKGCDGRLRAVLLAVALFSGGSADAIHDAVSSLLAAVRHPADERPALDRPGLVKQFDDAKIGATTTGRVEFAILDFDRAVRTHFWTNYPGLRGAFRTWIADAVGKKSVDERTRYAALERFAEQALRVARPEDLIDLAERWAEGTDLVPLAIRSIELGLGSARHGGRFRRQIYDWSTTGVLSPGLVEVVLQACVGVLAQTHPEQALVRLHHLARRQGGAAVGAVITLVDDDRLFVRLLERLADAFGRIKYRGVDIELFRTLADPRRLTADTGPLIARSEVNAALVVGWQTLLSGATALWLQRLRGWLDVAAEGPYRDLLLTVLIEACRDRPSLYGRLYVTAYRWVRESAGRAATANELTARIDAACGFDMWSGKEETP